MKTSRIILYVIIAIAAIYVAYGVLSKEPPPGWPINVIHLLTKHKLD